MKIRNVFLFLFLFFLQSLAARNGSEPLNMPRLVYAAELTCNIPPPSDLDIEAIGSTWVEVSWVPVLGATQYRLQAFDVLSGDGLASAMFVSGTATSAVVSTDGCTGTAYVRIWSVCENGEFDYNNYEQSDNFDTVIIDVVTSGFTMPSNYTTQVVGVGPSYGANIAWNGDMEYFNVRFTRNGINYGRRFALNVKSNSNPDVVNIFSGEQGNSQQHIIFAEELDQNNNPVKLLIKFRSDTTMLEENAAKIATLMATNITANGQGKFYREVAYHPDCIVEEVIPIVIQAKPGETTHAFSERNTGLTTNTAFAVNPNPFHQYLTVQLPETKEPYGTVLYLYDLLGVRQLTHVAPANQTACSLHTAQLEPGVYFLRIESNGTMETIKLLKTP